MIVKAPSKLYLAGEYAVLNSGSYAIIASVDKFTYLELIKSDEEKIISNIEDKSNILVYARKVAFDFVKKYDKFTYKYSTDLYVNNIKLGLGSSASITVVTIKAILQYYNFSYTKDDLFLLSVKALNIAGISGSMGDVACICYDDLILYKSINLSTNEYEIKKINLKNNLNINAIWTGIPASTGSQIKNMKQIIDTKEFKIFNEKSNMFTLELFKILETSNTYDLQQCIKNLRDNLKYFESFSNIKIYTDKINDIIKKNKNSKTSGAGLGDFVISLEFGEKDEKRPTHRIFFDTGQ
ncbi:mevalonate kinase family protein [Caviibacter abscessus]|uniref:mevalonate kinase family protein n=1 Tax=Caviibacter abscessus TaxID=1766719 RepID=UPI00082CD709|nr:hypothetical protein [Caviibacter abscessus]